VVQLVESLSFATGPHYQYFRAGNAADVQTKTLDGFALLAGGKDLDRAFHCMCERSGGGDSLIPRASGGDAYNPYIQGLCHVNSVAPRRAIVGRLMNESGCTAKTAVAVKGYGSIGLFSIVGARGAVDATTIFAIEINEHRRRLATRMQADYALYPAQDDVRALVAEKTAGLGVDVVSKWPARSWATLSVSWNHRSCIRFSTSC
jgi:hypothetical protein